jgi:hypothetical protein
MKTVSAFCLLVACLALFSGCSSDPTSDDFKEFAEGYASLVGGTFKLKDGSVAKVSCKVDSIDLKKTDSLTTPFIGNAKFSIDIADIFIYDVTLAGGKTKAIYHNSASLDFGWDGSKWVDLGGEKFISGVTLPDLSELQRERYVNLYNTKRFQVTPESSKKSNLMLLNGFNDPQ